MNRRTYLAAVSTASVAAAAGCSAVSDTQTISEPTVDADSPGRKTLVFEADDGEVGHVGVDGTVDSGRIDLSTEIWHREGTRVSSIRLNVWTPDPATGSPARVAVVSPVEGDSSPPPSISLYTPDRRPGTVVEITDLDDLADETISTLGLVVIPAASEDTELRIRATVELTGSGVLGSDYTLDGELQLAYPALAER
ncbi:hypothetical protein ABNG02_09685 [Halorubrum ejinorense]|uniref:DUF8121 domain-containing protein n=1 Tax=Halorubrum ejinorense TaxID=425309 RepID=A0AAV3SN10_9EURY